MGPSSQAYTRAVLCDMSRTNSNMYRPEDKVAQYFCFISADVAQLEKNGCVRLRKPLRKMKLFIPDRFVRLRKVARFEGEGCARFADFV